MNCCWEENQENLVQRAPYTTTTITSSLTWNHCGDIYLREVHESLQILPAHMRNCTKPYWPIAQEPLGLSHNDVRRKLNRFMLCGTMQEIKTKKTTNPNPWTSLLKQNASITLTKFYLLHISIQQELSVGGLTAFLGSPLLKTSG